MIRNSMWNQCAIIYWLIELTVCVRYPKDYGPQLCSSKQHYRDFHFIIAGAGSAGATLAARLSEEKSWNVLLLEYGEDAPLISDIPYLYQNMLNTDVDYQYKTEKEEKYFKGLQNEVGTIPRGKMAGGSSSINGVAYFRATWDDMESWKKYGVVGWGYDDVHPYMLKMEHFHAGQQPINKANHSDCGYLDVSPIFTNDTLYPVLGQAMEELGLSKVDDFNTGQALGYGKVDTTTIHGRRCSTARGYLSPASDRTNLFFARRVLVRKVIVNGSIKPKKATGVEILAPNGKICVVQATKEVILSLGSIGSPQVLMLSGIGPADHLKEKGLAVVANIPAVGKNFQDHAGFPSIVFSDRKNRSCQEKSVESSFLSSDTLTLIGEGIGTLGLNQFNAFINTKGQSYKNDIQFRMERIPYLSLQANPNQLMGNIALSMESSQLHAQLNEQSHLITVTTILSDVYSRGEVLLNTTDVRDHPIIRTNFLSDQRDIDTLLEGVKFGRRLAETSVLKNFGLQLERLDFKACRNMPIDSDQYWKCSVEQVTNLYYHPACTVRMGAADDDSAALTSDLKVKGFDNLRVVDASVMPKLVSRNINAPVVMIAEYAADMVKQSHQNLNIFCRNNELPFNPFCIKKSLSGH